MEEDLKRSPDSNYEDEVLPRTDMNNSSRSDS